MRLFSWNLNARRGAIAAQIEAISSCNPDIIALQEVTKTTAPALYAGLRAAGYLYVLDSLSLAPPNFVPSGPRRYSLITASRFEIHPLPTQPPMPWPERLLSALIQTPLGELEVHNTHVPPGSSNGWIKVDHLRGLFDVLARSSSRSRILCGDFNAPQTELVDGHIVTWGQRRTSSGGWKVARSIKGGPGIDWDSAERQVLTGLAAWGLVDVFRLLHGYGVEESSWMLKRRAGDVGRRFDHIFASPSVHPIACSYMHEFRVGALSDHSPVMADFDMSRAT